MAMPSLVSFDARAVRLFLIAALCVLPARLAAAEPTLLTKDGKVKLDPVFIKNGDELVYTVQESPTLLSLMALKLADGSAERVNAQALTNEFEAAFTADMRYLAFVQNRANLNLKLVIRDLKLGKDQVFDPGGGFAGMRKPTIAPDGSRVAFSIPTATGQQLASVNNQGKDRKDLTQTGINNWPAFSPDGKKIVYSSSRDGDFELFVMNADGSEPKRLTTSEGMDIRPSWSPDGKRIAFTSNRDKNYEIYIMKADGSDVRRLTNHDERDDYACWYPDGKRLACVRERDGKHDLYLIDVSD